MPITCPTCGKTFSAESVRWLGLQNGVRHVYTDIHFPAAAAPWLPRP